MCDEMDKEPILIKGKTSGEAIKNFAKYIVDNKDEFSEAAVEESKKILEEG